MKKNYVIIDLEMCKVPFGRRNDVTQLRMEIIEIGAVLVDENLEIIDQFKTFVTPEFGRLDSYIKKLTGIQETDLMGAPNFKDAINEFIKWIPKDAEIVSWSENDKNQIERELFLKKIELDEINKISNEWTDCQNEFTLRMNSERSYKLSEALIIADIDFDEQIHDALVDAKNTALLFKKLKSEDILTLSKHYVGEQAKELTYNPFEALLLNHRYA